MSGLPSTDAENGARQALSSSDDGSPYSPIGTILAQGSSELRLTRREWEVAELVALGYSYKRIAHELGISTRDGSVGYWISGIASRIPGDGNPKLKVAAWMWEYGSHYESRGLPFLGPGQRREKT